MNSSVISKAVKEFNRYRSPEATAKLISIGEKSFRIEFTGSFCETCGFHDYFDDFRISLEEADLKAKISQIEEKGDGAKVEFEITS